MPEPKTDTFKITVDEVRDGASYMKGSYEMCNQYSSTEAKKANPCKTIVGHIGKGTKRHFISFTPANVSNYKAIKKGETYVVPKLICTEPKSGKDYVGCKIVSKSPIEFKLA